MRDRTRRAAALLVGPVCFVCLVCLAGPCAAAAAAEQGDDVHVWQKVELTFTAEGRYANPYTDVTVWVDLEGPGFRKRCYGFWDGENVWRVRVAATAPGPWRWTSGSEPADAGLAGRTGAFRAAAWTEEELRANPLRRGFLRASANGHAFEHADGTPFFLVADTWWPTATFRYRWFDDDTPRPLGPKAGFKDYVRFRRGQEFNGIAMIAVFPQWHNDGKPARLKASDGTVIRAAWPQAGTQSAKAMTDEAGRRPFLFPGKVPGYEDVAPGRSGKPESCIGWAFAARTDDRRIAMLYFEKACRRATVSGLAPRATYRARWWDVRDGGWSDAGAGRLRADADGRLVLPPFPDGAGPAQADWALKLTRP